MYMTVQSAHVLVHFSEALLLHQLLTCTCSYFDVVVLSCSCMWYMHVYVWLLPDRRSCNDACRAARAHFIRVHAYFAVNQHGFKNNGGLVRVV